MEDNKRKLKVHHRSSPGPDTRTTQERGGWTDDEWKKLSAKEKNNFKVLLGP